MAKRGRPPMKAGKARNAMLVVRLSPKESKRLASKAKRCKQSVSVYARSRLLSIPRDIFEHIKRLAARAMEAERQLKMKPK